MHVLVDYILGYSGDPMECAIRFLLFVVIMNSIVNIACSLLGGTRL